MNRGVWKSLAATPLALACFLLSGAGQAAEAQAPAKPDLNRGQAIASQVCAACHAADGNSAGGAYPKLAGQHAEYLYKQLTEFKAQPGKTPVRNNAIMAGMVAALSDQDMRNVSAYFASQTMKPGAARDKDTVPLGQKIYRGGLAEKGVPACASCHGPTGAGMPSQYPRLSGQWAEYTAAQLVAFRDEVRKNNAPMHTVASRLSDKEIKAVADYIAGLR
ncbi:c-type cytochrome [Pandoraea sp. XJJ-1]|uniref:Cytochrome C n=1 Tax=Pandoraea cepalis TaxID=2508294 RepID=A0A5E4UX98_9BURK|nr:MULTISPECIES: c-type cytochrome [Pandoraea]MBN9115737.1 cytochrome c4 [Pandoraea sp.]OJY19861.1 MAG: cytochrome c4 [Pandoraea sp. 64-18]WAL82597.1 c-type cytochrome [Pandoraea sp. XJJ-1]VVE03160.1 cytochrome C [Pandoraea cepalis]BDD92345.1 cytochrome c [Pandoraea sp. NE5]